MYVSYDSKRCVLSICVGPELVKHRRLHCAGIFFILHMNHPPANGIVFAIVWYSILHCDFALFFLLTSTHASRIKQQLPLYEINKRFVDALLPISNCYDDCIAYIEHVCCILLLLVCTFTNYLWVESHIPFLPMNNCQHLLSVRT